MLRLLRQYYPVRNAVFVVCEGGLIFISVLTAVWLERLSGRLVLQEWLLLKTMLITFICLLCLYYNDLYNIKVSDTFFELAIRFSQALGAAAIVLAFLYLFFPGLIIGNFIFLVSALFLLS